MLTWLRHGRRSRSGCRSRWWCRFQLRHESRHILDGRPAGHRLIPAQRLHVGRSRGEGGFESGEQRWTTLATGRIHVVPARGNERSRDRSEHSTQHTGAQGRARDAIGQRPEHTPSQRQEQAQNRSISESLPMHSSFVSSVPALESQQRTRPLLQSSALCVSGRRTGNSGRVCDRRSSRTNHSRSAMVLTSQREATASKGRTHRPLLSLFACDLPCKIKTAGHSAD